MHPYPIVEQRPLTPVVPRGPFRRTPRRRKDDELPRPQAHQMLVYVVGGQYVMDNLRMAPDHESVVNATHVSVVDLRRNTPVAVQLAIPSAEASEFTVQVTFVCTVTDPATVVREGVLHAGMVLHGYLKSHRKIFELGLDYRMSDINDVRRSVNAQITAYTTVRPPAIRGLMVAMASVEVLTPAELADFERKRRSQLHNHRLAVERQQHDHTLVHDRERGDQILEQIREEHRFEREHRRQRRSHLLEAELHEHNRLVEIGNEQHTQLLAAERREFERRELAKAIEVISDDPRRALHLAVVTGHLDPTALAERLRRENDHDRAIEDAWAEQDREDRLLASTQAREDAQRALEWEREDRLHREDRVREDERRRLEVNLEILHEFTKRGHFDMTPVDLDRIVGEIVGPAGPELGYGSSRQLRASADAEPGGEVREEDGD